MVTGLTDTTEAMWHGETMPIPPVTTQKYNGRADILKEAERCIMTDRQSDYGSPEDNFQRIANLWNAYLAPAGGDMERPLAAVDVAMMMALLKVARQRGNPGHKDSYVDLAGYSACAGEIGLRNG